MNKQILTLCAIASIAVAVFSCSKKEDDKTPTTTTSTTSTTTPPPPTKNYPTPGSQQLAIDTTLFNYEVPSCMSIDQGRYALKGNMTGVFANAFTATFGKAPNFTNEFTIVTALPTMNSSTQIQLIAKLSGIDYTAQSGKVSFFKNMDSSGIQFTKLTFKGTNDSIVKISGFLQCP